MNVKVRHEGDVQRLEALIRTERNALQRDRFGAVLLALRGEQAMHIVEILGRSRRSVQAWVPRDQEQAFKERIKAGPAEATGACACCGARTRGASWSGSSAWPTCCRASTTCWRG